MHVRVAVCGFVWYSCTCWLDRLVQIWLFTRVIDTPDPTGSAVWGSYVDSVDVKCVSNAYSGMYRACLDLCYHELSVSYIHNNQYGPWTSKPVITPPFSYLVRTLYLRTVSLYGFPKMSFRDNRLYVKALRTQGEP